MIEQTPAPSWGYPNDARPHINANHIDGPMLVLRDGRVKWLSWGDRLLLWIKKTDAEKLERKYWRQA